jgi:hypothetical protein
VFGRLLQHVCPQYVLIGETAPALI